MHKNVENRSQMQYAQRKERQMNTDDRADRPEEAEGIGEPEIPRGLSGLLSAISCCGTPISP
jgi:hypothetical protein